MKPTIKTRVVQGIFQRDPETGNYLGHVPQIPGCATEGRTLEEVQRLLKEAAEGYVEALALAGEELSSWDSEITIQPISLEVTAPR